MGQPNLLPLIEQFVQHGTFLREWTPDTVRTYRYSLRELPPEVSKASLNDLVLALRQRGLSPGGINLRIRSINSFLTWLHEEGHVGERHRIKLLRNPSKPIDVLNDQDIKRLMTHRPHGKIERRTWTLAVLLLDCGLRINEALGLERANVDLDNLVLRVLGKGHKERLVPMSTELRPAGRYAPPPIQVSRQPVCSNKYLQPHHLTRPLRRAGLALCCGRCSGDRYGRRSKY